MIDLPNPTAPIRPRWNAADIAAFVAIAVIVVIGTLLRWGALGRESFWFDEGYTAWAVSLPPVRMLKVIRADVSPPGYYFLLHYWAAMFGQSEIALRSMSAFSSTLSMGVFWLLARRVLRERVAVVVAMGLFALSVMQIEYAKDARFYTLVTFLSLVSLYALHVFLDLRSRGKFSAVCMAAIVLSSALNIYSHNLMMLYVGMLNVLWLILPAREGAKLGLKQRLLDLILADAMIGLLYLPWLPGLLGQLHRVHGDFWASPPTPFQLFDEFALLAGVKNHYPTWMFYRVPVLYQYTAETVIGITVGVAAIFLLREVIKPIAKRSGDLLALTTYAVAPVIAVWLISRHARPLFIDRIFIASCPIFPLIFAAPFARVGASRASKIFAGCLVGLLAYWMALSVTGYWHEEHREDWRSAYDYVAGLPRQGRLIVFCANEGEICFDYYANQHGNPVRPGETLGMPEGFFELDPPRTSRRVLSDSNLDRLKAAVNSGRYTRIVYVRCHDGYSDPGGRVIAYLESRCHLIVEHSLAEGVLVYEFAPGPTGGVGAALISHGFSSGKSIVACYIPPDGHGDCPAVAGVAAGRFS